MKESQDLIQKYRKVRQYTLDLFRHVRAEDSVVQPVFYASPTKWHLAHTTWFFEEMILKSKVKDYIECNPDFGFLFNSYYNTIGERTLRAERGNITRPGVEEILEYRKYVDMHMEKFLKGASRDATLSLIELGLNHEEQHQELLLTDLKYTLGHNPTFPVYRDDFQHSWDKDGETGFVNMKEGIYEIGHEGEGFCFDNELKRHKVYLEAFEISNSLVTQGEYLEFIKEGGYENFEYWLDEGWTWVNENQIQAPMYWHKINGEWHHYTLAGLKKINDSTALAHVSFYEAHAFANWKGMRLPTEAEWEASADHFAWGERWEWTNSAYLPYPNYKTSEGAVGEYNGKFMINQMVLRGASVATSPGHSRKSYRNFFHPNFQWQFSGIRLVKKH